jgi:hypothetical protein
MLHHVIDWEAAIGEAVRVVRPGGIVLGYDLLDSAMTRLSHLLDRSEARPMRAAELRARVAALPVDAEIRETGRGLAARFALTKQVRPATPGGARSGSEPACA